MGRPKALLPVDTTGQTFLHRIVGTLNAAGLRDIVVVVGADAAAIRSAAPGLGGVRIVDNPDFERGQLTSLVAGLNAIDANAPAALVTLVDVPLVNANTVRVLIDTYLRRRAPITRPVSRGRHGHPVIFDRSLFEALRSADPSVGAKPIVRAHAERILEIEVDDEGAFADIDTREDYESLIGPLRPS